MQEVQIFPQSIDRFLPLVGPETFAHDVELADITRRRFEGRTIWMVNSTARGGGVAEMLGTLVGYGRGAGIDIRWTVLDGTSQFFAITKRLHNAIHEARGNGIRLDDHARAIYEEVSANALAEFGPRVRDGDMVLLHDPQTAGLIPGLAARGIPVIWRCHIGTERQGEHSRAAWHFLARYLEPARAFVFTREVYVPPVLDRRRTHIVAPSIDPFSPKNQPLSEAETRAILAAAGLIIDPGNDATATFARGDGTTATVTRQALIHGTGPLPAAGHRTVLQVSRWDWLKDPIGVMHGFARLAENDLLPDVHLILAGPAVGAVSDDPEAGEVLAATKAGWERLSQPVRERIHLVQLPMEDIEENAVIVNALQRRATVVVQKSLEEGFGLTVVEAMFKEKPVIASAVGGIVDQIQDGYNGWLVKNPRDPVEFGRALLHALQEPEEAALRARRARETAIARFLGIRSLRDYAMIFTAVDEGAFRTTHRG